VTTLSIKLMVVGTVRAGKSIQAIFFHTTRESENNTIISTEGTLTSFAIVGIFIAILHLQVQVPDLQDGLWLFARKGRSV